MDELLKIVRVYISLGVIALLGIVAYRVFGTYAWVWIPSGYLSMSPALQPGHLIRLDCSAAGAAEFKRGDVVAYVKDPREPDVLQYGRIVGLPGERFAITPAGEILVNGERLPEPGRQATVGEIPEILIPREHFFLLVDDRQAEEFKCRQSKADSRGLGPVPIYRLIGKAILS